MVACFLFLPAPLEGCNGTKENKENRSDKSDGPNKFDDTINKTPASPLGFYLMLIFFIPLEI